MLKYKRKEPGNGQAAGLVVTHGADQANPIPPVQGEEGGPGAPACAQKAQPQGRAWECQSLPGRACKARVWSNGESWEFPAPAWGPRRGIASGQNRTSDRWDVAEHGRRAREIGAEGSAGLWGAELTAAVEVGHGECEP